MPRRPRVTPPSLSQPPPSAGGVPERILNAACELFYREGIQAVGIQRVIDEAGIAKASLYAHFETKDALVAACLARRAAGWRSLVTERISVGRPDARAKILRLFDVLVEWIEGPDFCGCPFQKATGELSAPGHPARDVITAHRAWLHALMVSLVREAGARPPDRVAGALIVILDGAAATGLVDGATGPARHARWAAVQILDAATGSASTR